MTVITRFAPSPTGMLHIGNARTALINWLYARKADGIFILRIDDTDLERSQKRYEDAIMQDLVRLGLNWDTKFSQSSRINRYNEIKQQLIDSGRLYACYETQSELEVKRKLRLLSNLPPIYDRASLSLSEAKIDEYKNMGMRPHYRFKLDHSGISWEDMIKGQIHYEAQYISDPILIREDGSMTYMLCSTVDDIDHGITHVIRGEDHVTNTAIQMQLFDALSAVPPKCGHLSLIKAKEEKISKRVGGFEIDALMNSGIEPMAINSFLAFVGTSKSITPHKNTKSLINEFDIEVFSKSPTTYMPEELERINHKILLLLEYEDVRDKLNEIGGNEIDEDFWLAIRPNLFKLSEAVDWWNICRRHIQQNKSDLEYLKIAASLLPSEINNNTWEEWTKRISEVTQRTGKSLFLPLRLALTAMESGPELKYLLPLIGRNEILNRLT